MTGLIDLHMHTTLSDGTDTPEEITGRVRAAGIACFSVTDHDAVKAAQIITPRLGPGDPVFIPGVEFSCQEPEGKCHILGYGFDPDSESLRSVLRLSHAMRMEKVKARVEFLRKEFGFTFAKEDIDRLLALDNPGKPHIARLMVQYGYAPDKQQAMQGYINRIHFPDQYTHPRTAVEGIRAAGGVAVLAHPFYGSGDELVLGAEIRTRIARLKDYGLQGLEAYYSGFSDKLRAQALALAEEFGLYVTAGSDYHGENKLVRLGDTGLGDPAEGADGLRRFLERVAPKH